MEMQVSELHVNQDQPAHFKSASMGTRSRKCSMDHYSNKLLLDRNGNTCTQTVQKLASLSEDGSESKADINDENTDNSEQNTDESWKKTLINQIQNLLQDVNLSQTHSDDVYDELIVKALNSNSVKNRRSSCFTLSCPGVSQKRRGSVTLQQNIQNNSQSRGRRMSHANIASSVQKSSRRSSVAMLPSYNGRRLSCTNNNFLPNGASYLRQRRKSSAKPMTVSVSKVSSVQKQLHKIYKKRRRKERASINIAEVRSALRGPDYDGSSDHENDNDISLGDRENSVDDDCNSEVWEDVPDKSSATGIETDAYPDVNDDIIDGEVVPVVRRKDSTQIRAWELSHRLRERRRGRRQVSANF